MKYFSIFVMFFVILTGCGEKSSAQSQQPPKIEEVWVGIADFWGGEVIITDEVVVTKKQKDGTPNIFPTLPNRECPDDKYLVGVIISEEGYSEVCFNQVYARVVTETEKRKDKINKGKKIFVFKVQTDLGRFAILSKHRIILREDDGRFNVVTYGPANGCPDGYDLALPVKKFKNFPFREWIDTNRGFSRWKEYRCVDFKKGVWVNPKYKFKE